MPPRTRRTPAEKHAYHAAQAEKHRLAAIFAQDPTLRSADDLRDMLAGEAPDNAEEEACISALLIALSAFIDGRLKA